MGVTERTKRVANLKACVADRACRLRGEGGFEILALAKRLEKQGKDVIHLEIGEPDFDTPENVKERAIQAIREGHTYYVPSAGIDELREAVCVYMKRTRGIDVSPEEVIITPGAKPVVFLSFLLLLEEGDEVIYPDPGYPTYRSVIDFVGARAVPLRLKEENEFRVDIDELRRLVTPRTKMIVLNSPQNPTGSVLPYEDMAEIARLAEEEDLLIFTDEVYCEIIYDEPHVSILQFPGMKERTVLLDAFSKTFAMTGWRLGYAVLPKDLAPLLALLVTNSNSCTCTFTQMAGVEALLNGREAVQKMVAEFHRRRDFLVERMKSIEGLSFVKPKGAFYIFPNISSFGLSSQEMMQYLLEEAGVATVPGTAFGDYGEGYIRISFANSLENLAKAMDRIEYALKKLERGGKRA